MIVAVLVFFALIVSFVYAPKITAALATAVVIMFLYVWIYDPQCQNWAKDHPEWPGKCGIQFR